MNKGHIKLLARTSIFFHSLIDFFSEQDYVYFFLLEMQYLRKKISTIS